MGYSLCRKRIDILLEERNYDFVFTLLPEEGQHGHHKTAVLMGLRAVKRFKGPNKPIIIAGSTKINGNKDNEFSMLSGFPETKINATAPHFRLNRAYRFAENDKLSYKIVADWVIAEYKSQGAIQENAIHKVDEEVYYYYDINDSSGIEKVKKLFEDLSKSGFQPMKNKFFIFESYSSSIFPFCLRCTLVHDIFNGIINLIQLSIMCAKLFFNLIKL